MDDGLVCAWCDVYDRIECEARDENGRDWSPHVNKPRV
jgi:hypothetical protein